MAGLNLARAPQQIQGAAPFVYAVDSGTDAGLRTFLASLTDVGGDDISQVPIAKALWATEVADGANSGTTYIVSAEARIYIQSGRY